MGLISGLGNAVDRTFMGVVNAGVKVQQGLLLVGGEISQAMYDIYSMDGLEKWTKAAIANINALGIILGSNAFVGVTKTLGWQKDLIYASLAVDSTAEFVEVTKIQKSDGTEIKKYSLQLPRIVKKNPATGKTETEIDWVKVLYGIGNPFETLGFLQKYGVISFPASITNVAAQIGATKLFSFNQENWKVGDVPVVKCLFNKPKDFFVCIASAYSGYKCMRSSNFWDLANLLKLAGSLGKIVLITTADYMLKNKNNKAYLIAFVVIDVVTQNASLIGLLLKRRRERESRLKNPPVAA